MIGENLIKFLLKHLIVDPSDAIARPAGSRSPPAGESKAGRKAKTGNFDKLHTMIAHQRTNEQKFLYDEDACLKPNLKVAKNDLISTNFTGCHNLSFFTRVWGDLISLISATREVGWHTLSRFKSRTLLSSSNDIFCVLRRFFFNALHVAFIKLTIIPSARSLLSRYEWMGKKC